MGLFCFEKNFSNLLKFTVDRNRKTWYSIILLQNKCKEEANVSGGRAVSSWFVQ